MNEFLTQSEVNRQATRKGISVNAFLVERQKKFEALTGVKWSAVHQNDGYEFHPIDEGIEQKKDEALALKIEEVYWKHNKSKFVPQYMSYIKMKWCIGVGNVELTDLIGVVKWMEKQGKALRTVDRMGKGYAFKMKEV